MSKGFHCEQCHKPAPVLSLSTKGPKWICPSCALDETGLNARQRARLKEQLGKGARAVGGARS
jgi:hypothetical protein